MLHDRKEKNRGVTLIALIVTIIVLIILAGVSIGMIVGNEGIVTQAQTAKKETEESARVEEDEIEKLNLEIAYQQLPKDDDLDTSLKTFIALYQTTQDNQTIVFPLYGESTNLAIDFGDGTVEQIGTKYLGKDEIKHTYEKMGKYEVKITGNCSQINYFSYPTDKDKIIQLIQWGTVFTGTINFTDCENLTGNIPSPNTNTMKTINNVSRIFKNTNVTGQIPPYLFYGGTQITLAYEAFMGCENLNSFLPKTLLKDLINLEQIHDMFSDSGIKGEIPEDFFANNIKLNRVDYIFSNCKGITGKIAGNLFDYNLELTSFRGVFRGCNITEVDSYLFSKNTNATDFVNVFRECAELQSIPEGLFSENEEAELFNDCFRDCISLKSIPESLFSHNVKVTNFTETFYNCGELEGSIEPLWQRTGEIIGTDCFYGCNKLMNYNEIPEEWK